MAEYQERFLIYCEKTGQDTEKVLMVDFILWVNKYLKKFYEKIGLCERVVLTELFQVEFNKFLKEEAGE